MSHHRCNCCEDGPCVQPGPCCEPDFAGRCTPRGWSKLPDGTWTGPPATALPTWIRAAGRIIKKLSRLEAGLPEGTYAQISMNVLAPETDPRNRFNLGVQAGVGPQCPAFSGNSGGWQNTVPLETPFIEPGCGVAPVVNEYGQYLLCQAAYSPGAGITVPPSTGPGALARYVVELGSWDVKIKFEVRCFRGGQSVSTPATALVWGVSGARLCARAQDGPGAPMSERCLTLGPGQVTAVALNPCGTRVRIAVKKPAYDVPWPFLDDEAPARPAGPDSGVGSPGTPSGCTVGTGLDVDVTFDIGVGESIEGEVFVPCVNCGDAPTVPCPCQTAWIGRSLGGGLWEPPTLNITCTNTYTRTAPPPSPAPPGTEWVVSSVMTVIAVRPAGQCSDSNDSTCGARFRYVADVREVVNTNLGITVELKTVPVQVGFSAQSGVTVGCFGAAFVVSAFAPTEGYAVWFDAGRVGVLSQPVQGTTACPLVFSEPTIDPPSGMTVQNNGAFKTVRTAGTRTESHGVYQWDHQTTITGLVQCRSSLPAGAGGGGAPATGGDGCSGCGGGIA